LGREAPARVAGERTIPEASRLGHNISDAHLFWAGTVQLNYSKTISPLIPAPAYGGFCPGKSLFRFLLLILALCGFCLAAGPPPPLAPSGSAVNGPQKTAPAANPDVEAALNSMDRTAAGFHCAYAAFTWDQYELVVDEHTWQTGGMSIRKSGNGTEMAADITGPPGQEKYVLVKDEKIQVYEPRINRVTQYSAGKNREAFESFLLLGFGGGGHQLLNQFTVAPGAPVTETVDGVTTIKLELTPKSPKVQNFFAHIELWIDPKLGVSRRQKLIDPSGNYRLATYSGIRIDDPKALPAGAFDLEKRTNRGTQIVQPQ
jgi:outer membrane lipoprotein-sorting protein